MKTIKIASFEEYLNSKKPNLSIILKIFISLAKSIHTIHSKNIIHKNLNPSTVFIDLDTDEVSIRDSIISYAGKIEKSEDINPEKIEGNVYYIPPEQTGRTNHSIDNRSDYYSFGAVLYRALTGIPPFNLNDQLELIHELIAVNPVSPHERNNEIPRVLSEITMKLLEKSPNERYQSLYGLIIDLENCRNQLQKSGTISEFPIGEHDVSTILKIPNKLYGREEEIEILLDEFSYTKKGDTRLIFISGPPGIGKSFLAEQLQNELINEEKSFITGKFDQHKQNIPYSAIAQAFQDPIKQLLTLSDNELLTWAKKIQDAVGINGQLIIDIIPELQFIIGEQKTVEKLPTTEAQNRFIYTFRNFINIFTSKSKPLVVFIDDLQWADTASLQVINAILSDNTLNHILFIGTYRDVEAQDNDSLMKFLDSVIVRNQEYKSISLTPIKINHIEMLLNDTLLIEPDENKKFIDLIIEKTGGNPLFIKEFLTSLHKGGYINFQQYNSDNKDNFCLIDTEKILQACLPDNIIGLLTGRIIKFSNDALEVLKIAACLNIEFSLDIIAEFCEKSPDEILLYFEECIRENIVTEVKEGFRFIHDKVQEAVYSLIPETEKKHLHKKLGQLLLNNYTETDLHENIFFIVEQMNLAFDLVKIQDERNILARLNTTAGKRAKDSTAYKESQKYFEQAIDLLPNDSWEVDYKFTMDLYISNGEIMFLNGETEQAEEYLNVILGKTKNNYDIVKIYELKVLNYYAAHNMVNALNYCKKILSLIGFKGPKNPGKLSILKELIKTKIYLLPKSIEDLEEIPEIKDQHLLFILRMLFFCSHAPGLAAPPEYLAVQVMKQLIFTLKNGNSKYSSYIFGFYGILLLGALDDIELGNRFNNLSLKMFNKNQVLEIKAIMYFAFGCFTNHYEQHMGDGTKYLLEGYKAGVETGNLMYASFSINHYLFIRFFCGDPINELLKQFESYLEIQKQLNQKRGINEFYLWYQFIINLSDIKNDQLFIKGELFNEDEMIPQWIEMNDLTDIGYYTVAKQILYFLHERHDQALEIAEKGEKLLHSLMAMVFVPEYYFYYSLSLISLYQNATKSEKKRYLKKVKKNQKKMKKWAFYAPKNYEHKYLIVKALQKGLKGYNKEAASLYEKAINSAQINGFTQNEAIANECAAKFYLSSKMISDASRYMTEAYHCYSVWGVKSKLKQLEQQYPDLLTTIKNQNDKDLNNTSAKFPENESESPSLSSLLLDLRSVNEAAKAISDEKDITKLLNNLITIVMKNTGSQRSLLLLNRDDKLYTEIESSVIARKIITKYSLPLSENSVPESVIRFTMRTKDTIVLNNASEEKHFYNDSYIMTNTTKSIACIPLIRNNLLLGILYLENNLNEGVFTAERLEALKSVCTQIIIVLENTLLKNLKPVKNITENSIKYTRSSISDEQYNEYIEKLIKYIEYEKPYLNYDTTLIELAKILQMNSNNLSQVINQKMGVNFNKFMNEYRIQEAIRLLVESRESKKKIIEIAFDSGFKSKSAFNNVFKEFMGMTPTEFLKTLKYIREE